DDFRGHLEVDAARPILAVAHPLRRRVDVDVGTGRKRFQLGMVTRALRLDFQAHDFVSQGSLADFATPLQGQGDDVIEFDGEVDTRHFLVGQVDGVVDVDPHRFAQASLGPLPAFESLLPAAASDADVNLDLIDIPRFDVRPRSVLVNVGGQIAKKGQSLRRVGESSVGNLELRLGVEDAHVSPSYRINSLPFGLRQQRLGDLDAEARLPLAVGQVVANDARQVHVFQGLI